MLELVARARQFAIDAHGAIDHRRKYSGEPYHVHLERVAAMVEAAGGDAETIAAAWLHDVVEDTPTTFAQLEQLFGPSVASLVEAMTDVPHSLGNRAKRKEIDRARLAAADARVHNVKLADLTDNLRDICRHDKHFGRVFLKEANALMRVLDKGSPALIQGASLAAQECRQLVGNGRRVL